MNFQFHGLQNDLIDVCGCQLENIDISRLSGTCPTHNLEVAHWVSRILLIGVSQTSSVAIHAACLRSLLGDIRLDVVVAKHSKEDRIGDERMAREWPQKDVDGN